MCTVYGYVRDDPLSLAGVQYVSVGPGALSCYGAHQAYILRPIHPFTRRESEIMAVGGEGGGGAAGSPHLHIYSYTLDKASLPLRLL